MKKAIGRYMVAETCVGGGWTIYTKKDDEGECKCLKTYR